MNAIERRTKRELRFKVLKRIEKLEKQHCEECPVKFCNDPNTCKICPVFRQIFSLGEELASTCERKEFSDIVETPKIKQPAKKKKKTYGPRDNLTKEQFIAAIVKYAKISVMSRKLEIPETTIRHRAERWGLTGLTRDDAIEMLDRSMMGGNDIA